MKSSTKLKNDFLFDKYHFKPLFKVQQPSTTLECNTLVALVNFLSTNKLVENAIRRKHSEINVWQNNVALILFILFIS